MTLRSWTEENRERLLALVASPARRSKNNCASPKQTTVREANSGFAEYPGGGSS
jgi:hypothetical protein